MHNTETINKWKVGKHVIVELPYQRKAIGEIQKVTCKTVHVMYNDHEVIFGIDGEEFYNGRERSVCDISIRIPDKGELSEVIIENKRKKLSQIDLNKLTSEQVNDIFREMKRLGVF